MCDLLLDRRRGKAVLQLFNDTQRGYTRNDKKHMPSLARYADTLAWRANFEIWWRSCNGDKQ